MICDRWSGFYFASLFFFLFGAMLPFNNLYSSLRDPLGGEGQLGGMITCLLEDKAIFAMAHHTSIFPSSLPVIFSGRTANISKPWSYNFVLRFAFVPL
jgi:hypothetical protein